MDLFKLLIVGGVLLAGYLYIEGSEPRPERPSAGFATGINIVVDSKGVEHFVPPGSEKYFDPERFVGLAGNGGRLIVNPI